ncbi:MAG TPA: hypothetical protein VFN28_13050, partial [Amaricoccus sp.]|nr:hypothetical protein [Amaricoccus sp.]
MFPTLEPRPSRSPADRPATVHFDMFGTLHVIPGDAPAGPTPARPTPAAFRRTGGRTGPTRRRLAAATAAALVAAGL